MYGRTVYVDLSVPNHPLEGYRQIAMTQQYTFLLITIDRNGIFPNSMLAEGRRRHECYHIR
jgi:hypothetical protein